MKQLTEPQAWRKIGNHILNGGEMEYGVCHLAYELFSRDAIRNSVYAAMINRATDQVLALGPDANGLCPIYLAPQRTQREARAMLAYIMALEAEDES